MIECQMFPNCHVSHRCQVTGSHIFGSKPCKCPEVKGSALDPNPYDYLSLGDRLYDANKKTVRANTLLREAGAIHQRIIGVIKRTLERSGKVFDEHAVLTIDNEYCSHPNNPIQVHVIDEELICVFCEDMKES